MPVPGGTTARRYGTQHQRLKRRWAPIVAAGGVNCAKCGQPIPATARTDQWHLGHIPGSGKQLYSGPEHQACNSVTTNERATRDPAPRPRTQW